MASLDPEEIRREHEAAMEALKNAATEIQRALDAISSVTPPTTPSKTGDQNAG